MTEQTNAHRQLGTQPKVEGALLVGSVNLDSAETVFRAASWACGTDLMSMPDGETGERFHWILFQGAVFDLTDGLERLGPEPIDLAGFDVRPFGVNEGVDPASIVFPELGYAEAALHSHRIFQHLRDDGIIPSHVRFQVSLPTPVATVFTFAAPQFRAALEGPYEAALLRELDAIRAAIPAADLAIQWDMAVEFALIEGANIGGSGPATAWFGDAFEGAVERATRLGAAVPEGVLLGYHLCYGDVGEKHFVEPSDTGNLVKVANAIFSASQRAVDYVHMPVPIERSDDAYFQPLADLKLPEHGKLYLGLIHREDGLDGALKRVAAAGKFAPAFGVATECGMGRSPRESVEPLLALHHQVVKAAQQL